MPTAPRRPCARPGCRHLQPCPVHGKRPNVPSSTLRRQQEPGKRLYDQRRWRRVRQHYLRDHPLCVDCRAAGRTTLAAHVDHVQPHKGDDGLFWDPDNWRALCARCHGRRTRAQQQQGPPEALKV